MKGQSEREGSKSQKTCNNANDGSFSKPALNEDKGYESRNNGRHHKLSHIKMKKHR